MDIAEIILEKLKELYRIECGDGLPMSDIIEAYSNGVRSGLQDAIDEVEEVIRKRNYYGV